MKKFVITALMVAGSFGFVNAQAKQKVVAHKATPATTVTTSQKAAPVVSTTTSIAKVEKNKAHNKASSVTVASTHLKKDATPDKRFKENKAVAKSTTPLKKNGTPDLRYKANKKK